MKETRVDVDLSKIAGECSSFAVFMHEGYSLIRVSEPLAETDAALLNLNIGEIESLIQQSYLVDFSQATELNEEWLIFLTDLANRVTAQNRKVVAYNLSMSFQMALKQKCDQCQINFCDSWADAMGVLGVKHTKGTLVAEVTGPFLEAASKALEAQMGASCTSGSPMAVTGSDKIRGDICGIIPLDCGSFRAIVVITFPQATIFQMVGKLTGSPPLTFDSLVSGSVGEITNITFTRGKKRLNEIGYGIKSAIPKVYQQNVLPDEFQHYKGKGVVVPFTTNCGECFAEIRLAA